MKGIARLINTVRSNQRKRLRREELTLAAHALLFDDQFDAELTAFTALDGDNIHTR